MNKVTLGRCERLIAAIAFVNFAAFIAGYILLGGDALNGKFENGRYLLADHGRYTEVSHAVFVYSEIHGASIFVTHALALAAFLDAKSRKRE